MNKTNSHIVHLNVDSDPKFVSEEMLSEIQNLVINLDIVIKKKEIIKIKRKNPSTLIGEGNLVKIDNDIHVQVDTIITFPRYSSSENTESQWMPARWTPERGLKGYTIGNLYTALGNYFNMSIGDRGVTAKVRDGKRVSSRIRKGAVLKTISTNIQTFILDIAKEIAGENLTIGRSLSRNQGMNPQNIKIQDLALGIKALAETLEINGEISSSSNMISEILNLYQAGLKKNTDSKLSRGLDQKSYEKLLKLNEKVYNIVKSEMES